MFGIGWYVYSRNSAEVKAKLAGFGDDPLALCHAVHISILSQSSLLRKADRAAFGFWLPVPVAATMLDNGRLAADPSTHPQSQSKRGRSGKARRTLRADPRCDGGIRTSALAGE